MSWFIASGLVVSGGGSSGSRDGATLMKLKRSNCAQCGVEFHGATRMKLVEVNSANKTKQKLPVKKVHINNLNRLKPSEDSPETFGK